jgi:hypothetical protein
VGPESQEKSEGGGESAFATRLLSLLEKALVHRQRSVMQEAGEDLRVPDLPALRIVEEGGHGRDQPFHGPPGGFLSPGGSAHPVRHDGQGGQAFQVKPSTSGFQDTGLVDLDTPDQ